MTTLCTVPLCIIPTHDTPTHMSESGYLWDEPIPGLDTFAHRWVPTIRSRHFVGKDPVFARSVKA